MDETNAIQQSRDDDHGLISLEYPTKLWEMDFPDSTSVSQELASFLALTYGPPIHRRWKLLRLSDLDIYSSFRVRLGGSDVPARSCLEYFLKHANISKLLVDRVRVVDFRKEIRQLCLEEPVRCMDEVVFYHPAGTTTLLRHGARFFEDENDSSESLEPLASMCVALLVRMAFVESLEITERKNDVHRILVSCEEELLEGIKVAGMILMTLRNPHLATYLISGAFVMDDRFVENHPQAGYYMMLPGNDKLVPFFDKYFPGWELGRVMPPRLKHICRCCIRDTLYNNWHLPDGLSQLGMPRVLEDYLCLSVN